MAVEQGTSSERLLAARARYVARGIATPPIVVARAEGARIEDVDGRSYIDFAGGIGCQNTGHGLPAAVAAIHEQVDRYLHQCFMVGTYEPYVEVCRRLAGLWPGPLRDAKSLLVNSGAEAVENAVKIARAATGRPAVIAFDNGFHGRTLLTMTMTSKLVYRRGFGPFAPEVHRVMGRTGPVWAIERYGVEPDLLVSGKSLGGGLPLAAVTGRPELMDAVVPGGLGGTFGGNPLACAAALVA